MKLDPTSQSNADELHVTAMNIVLDIDFEQQILNGYVDYTAVAELSGVTALMLDTRALNITRASDAISGTDLEVPLFLFPYTANVPV